MIPVEVPKDQKGKIKALEAASTALEKDYGKGSIRRMGSREIVPVRVIPTGIYGVDAKVIGVGGIPRGRITEIYGPESSGKTTLALHAVASAQREGGTAAFIDAEHALDPIYAAALGVDVDNMFISQPDNGEQALDITLGLIGSGAVDIVVIDSVAALVPQAELDGEMGDSHMGLQARLMSQACRKLTGITQRTDTAVIFINQIREKIGVMFGSPETTTGGRALKFYASLRLDVRRISTIKDGEESTGNRTKIKAVKNKLASPFVTTEVDLNFGLGMDGVGSLVEAALSNEAIFEKSGAWYTFKPTGERFQGKGQVIAAARENEQFTSAIRAELEK